MTSPTPDPRVRAGDEPGMWYVRNTESGVVETWRIGSGYRLVSVLGCGSFGAVCKALDLSSNNRLVALKRVPDALSNLDAAKRVLREVVVLNRLDHPNVIKIFDIFWTPATQGARVMDVETLKLIPLSIDLYMAFEIAEGGDLYEMRGEMSSSEVRNLMKQLTSAVLHLHQEGVWHRDIKSANTLCGMSRLGGRVVKICDFGSARGARASDGSYAYGQTDSTRGVPNNDDYMVTEEEDETQLDVQRELRRRKRVRNNGVFGDTSMGSMASLASSGSEKEIEGLAGNNFGNNSRTTQNLSKYAMRDMLTSVVATPCYRAPEVIMTTGGYNGAMDVWSLGCIFGELLQRQQQHALTPNLTISPLFRFDDDPIPRLGTNETYTELVRDVHEGVDKGLKGLSNISHQEKEEEEIKLRRSSRARARLDLFFNVVGTPSWRDVEKIPNVKFRNYLRGIRGRAGSLTKQFNGCDDSAKDLLLRMLCFDPDGRASPREILSHEYFKESERDSMPRDMSISEVHQASHGFEMDLEGQFEIEYTREDDVNAPPFEMDVEPNTSHSQNTSSQNFWELDAPRAALAALEVSFAEVADVAQSPEGGGTKWRMCFKEWFEHECERRTRSGHGADTSGRDTLGSRVSRVSHGTNFSTDPPPDAPNETSFGSFEDLNTPGRLTRAFPLFFRSGEKPVAWAGVDGVGTRVGGVDAGSPGNTYTSNVMSLNFEQRYLGGAFGTTGVFGQGGVGLSSARDFVGLGDARSLPGDLPSAPSLGALGHLGANRHGEWGEEDLPTAMKRVSVSSGSEAWGVTAVPPGMAKEEGALYASMSNQQGSLAFSRLQFVCTSASLSQLRTIFSTARMRSKIRLRWDSARLKTQLFFPRANKNAFKKQRFKILARAMGLDETPSGLRLASNGNEKLARLRRARKEVARTDEAALRRTNDARVNELHAQLEAKLRDRNERRAKLLRPERERVGVDRETRESHAAAERNILASQKEQARFDESARTERRRAAFQRRRRTAETERKWDTLNEPAADEAQRTPRLREVKSERIFTTINEVLVVTRNSAANDEGSDAENLAAARESAAARNNTIATAQNIAESTSDAPPDSFDFAVVTKSASSPQFMDEESLRVARAVRRGDTDLRSVANECEVLDDLLDDLDDGSASTSIELDESIAETLDASVGSIAGTVETSGTLDSSPVRKQRVFVKPGGVAWASPGSSKSHGSASDKIPAASFSSPNRHSSRRLNTHMPSKTPSMSSPDFESRLRGTIASVRRSREKDTGTSDGDVKSEKTVAEFSIESRPKVTPVNAPLPPQSTPSGVSLFECDSVDPCFDIEKCEHEVQSMRRMEGIVQQLAVGSEVMGETSSEQVSTSEVNPSAVDLSARGAVLSENPSSSPVDTVPGVASLVAQNHKLPTQGPLCALEAMLKTQNGGRRRGRRKTRREKQFGKLPFRVAGAALEVARKAGGGALKLFRAAKGIVGRGERRHDRN